MHRLGVSARFFSQPADRFAVHLRQPRRLPHAASFIQMLQNRQRGRRRKLRAKQHRAFSFAEALATGFAAQKPRLALAVAIADIQIAGVAFAVKLTGRVQTTEA